MYAKCSVCVLALLVLVKPVVSPEQFWMNGCNGRGSYDKSTKKCTCDDGFGSANDVSNFKDPACGLRVCPVGQAWVGIPSGATTGLGLAECSNMGDCERSWPTPLGTRLWRFTTGAATLRAGARTST